MGLSLLASLRHRGLGQERLEPTIYIYIFFFVFLVSAERLSIAEFGGDYSADLKRNFPNFSHFGPRIDIRNKQAMVITETVVDAMS